MPDVYKECGEAHNKDVFKVDILCAQANLDSPSQLPTLPTLGSFLSDECVEILTSLEALHGSLSQPTAAADNNHDSAD
jgi:hypothetical protein